MGSTNDYDWLQLVNIYCDIFAVGTSSAERLRDLDLSINKTL